MDETQYIMAGRLIDGSGISVRRNVFLAMQGGVIADIGSAAMLSGEERARATDFSHCTVIPPLVDCSVSLSHTASTDMRLRQQCEEDGDEGMHRLISRNIHYCHSHGVLGVADGDDWSNNVERYRSEAGPGVSITIRTSGRTCCRPDDCAATVTRRGCDFLKIGYTRNIEHISSPMISAVFDREDLFRIHRHRAGRKTVVVANGREHVAAALDAGCDAVEQGYFMGEENLERMAAEGTLWLPGVLRAKVALELAGPGDAGYRRKVLSGQLAQLEKAGELGVNTAVGSGAGSSGIIHGEAVAEEIKLFMKAGFSLVEALRCASWSGANFFGMDNLGLLEVGQPATFILSRGMVQQLPRKLSYLEGIYIDGAPSRFYRKNPVKTVHKR